MTSKLTLTLAASALALVTGAAQASTIGYVSNVTTGNTELPYTLTLQKFDPALGTLTGVTLIFSGEEQITNLTFTNTGANTTTFDAAATANLVGSSTNTADNADRFNGLTLAVFDTGISTPGVLGGCNDPSAPSFPPPGTCSQISVAANSSANFAPITIMVEDPVYHQTIGTGVQGVTGVLKNSVNLASYIGTGTFDLTGTTVNALTTSGAGGNIQATQTTTARFQAEVDYTYTALATPEPATSALLGSALVFLGFVGRRSKR